MNISKNQLKNISNKDMPILNVGSGESITIKKLASLIKKLTNFKGRIIFDKKYPDGTINKNLDGSKLKKLGWKANILLKNGLKKALVKTVSLTLGCCSVKALKTGIDIATSPIAESLITKMCFTFAITLLYLCYKPCT